MCEEYCTVDPVMLVARAVTTVKKHFYEIEVEFEQTEMQKEKEKNFASAFMTHLYNINNVHILVID